MESLTHTELGRAVLPHSLLLPNHSPSEEAKNESSSGVLGFETLLGGRYRVCSLHINLTIMKTKSGCKHLYCSLYSKSFNMYI